MDSARSADARGGSWTETSGTGRFPKFRGGRAVADAIQARRAPSDWDRPDAHQPGLHPASAPTGETPRMSTGSFSDIQKDEQFVGYLVRKSLPTLQHLAHPPPDL